jgi:hypothetical protein
VAVREAVLGALNGTLTELPFSETIARGDANGRTGEPPSANIMVTVLCAVAIVKAETKKAIIDVVTTDRDDIEKEIAGLPLKRTIVKVAFKEGTTMIPVAADVKPIALINDKPNAKTVLNKVRELTIFSNADTYYSNCETKIFSDGQLHCRLSRIATLFYF